MEDDLPIDRPRFRIPIGWIRQVRYEPKIVQTVEVRENFLSMGEKIREDIVIVVGSRKNITEKDVELCGEEVYVHTKPSKAGIGLIIKVLVQTVLLAQQFYLRACVESVQFLQQSLFIDLSSNFFTKI